MSRWTMTALLACLLIGCGGGDDGGGDGDPDTAAAVDTLGDAAEPGADTTTPRDDALEPPEDALEPPEDTLEPPEDTIEPPEDTIEPPEDTVEPPEDTIEPPEDTVEPPEDTVEPPEDTIPPEDTGGDEYGAFWGVWHDGSYGHIIRFDIGDTDSYELVASTNWILFTDLEFDGDGNLYAWKCGNGFAGGSLYLVDQDTGDLQHIGDGDTSLNDLAWNPVDKTMYGTYPWAANAPPYQTKLYTVDLQTGATTLVGGIEDDGPSTLNWMSGLGIDSEGSFYYYNNAANGAAENEQGIWKSKEPGNGLDVELAHDLAAALSEPVGSFQVGPLFVDWSRDDRGYGSVRYQPGMSTTHTYHFTFDDDKVLESWKLDANFGTIWGIAREPAL